MRKLVLGLGLLGFAFGMGGSFGCAASHRAAARGHDNAASHDMRTGHPIKAIKEKGRAEDERAAARRDEF